MAGFINNFRHSKFYPLLQRVLRTLQFLSALSSLVVFSIRIRKLLKLQARVSTATGAVEGIVAAAVAYTLVVLLLSFAIKNGGSKMLRWALVALDIAFVGAFIAVAVLTRRNGEAGYCKGTGRGLDRLRGFRDQTGCNLPLGTFITAIISTILHALSAIFQNVRQNHKEHRDERVVKDEQAYNGSSVGPSTGRPSTNHGIADAHLQHNHNPTAAV